MNRDRLYLTHVVECINRIRSYTEGGESIFREDLRTQDAVLRNLHTLSESATRLSAELQQAYPDVAWKEIHAFRNVVVHDYLGLDVNQVWGIIINDIPVLLDSINVILAATERE